jgi:hypothetical protein
MKLTVNFLITLPFISHEQAHLPSIKHHADSTVMVRDTKYVIPLILAANASCSYDDYLISRRFGIWRRNETAVT